MTPRLTPQQRAVRAYERGATTRAIADDFGVDNTTVGRWLLAAGIDRRPRGPRELPIDTELIVALRDEQEASWAVIAAEVGMSVTGVRRRYRAATEPGWTRY